MKAKKQEKNFKTWMDRHRALIFKIVRSYCSHREDQEDLFQEISTQLWKSVPSFKAESSETTWIYRVSLFRAMSWTRTEKRRREGWEEIRVAVEAMREESKRENPRLSWLYEQIHLLPEIDRSLCLLLLDGYSYREMADILGLSENHVGVKINRIKKKITKRFDAPQSNLKENIAHGN